MIKTLTKLLGHNNKHENPYQPHNYSKLNGWKYTGFQCPDCSKPCLSLNDANRTFEHIDSEEINKTGEDDFLLIMESELGLPLYYEAIRHKFHCEQCNNRFTQIELNIKNRRVIIESDFNMEEKLLNGDNK